MLMLCLFSLHQTIQKSKTKNNNKKTKQNNITPYGENFYQLTYWDKI